MASHVADVTIVGAGIAGMAAALRLLEAGFSVKVIEAASNVGGKFGAVFAKQHYHDFAWHIFADWCRNFWDIVESIGLDRHRDFVARPTLTLLRPWQSRSRWPRAASVSHVGAPDFFWHNANSGVAHWSDVMLFTHSLYALLCDSTLDREEFLNRVTVNGYMRSLPHMSDVAALLHNELLLRIWAIPSYSISARSYQTHLRLVTPSNYRASPLVVMRRNFREAFWAPFIKKLESFGPRFTLATDTRLRGIRLAPQSRGVESIVVDVRGESPRRSEDVNQLIVAIPPAALFAVLSDPDSRALRDAQPGLLDVGKLPSQQTSALSLYLRRPIRVPGVGDEPIALIDDFEEIYAPATLAPRNGLASDYGLSLIDVGRLGGAEAGTVLSVLASDADALERLPDDEAARRLIEVLQRYLPFEDRDIDWTHTHFQGHRGERLFVNAVGSWEYRPEVRLHNSAGDIVRDQIWQDVPNLYLAGDFCRSQIDIVSIEGAIHTGLWAAHALSTRVREKTGSRAPAVREPTPPARWERAEGEARKVLDRLGPWAEVAARRSRAVSGELKAAARDDRARVQRPSLQTPPPATNHHSPQSMDARSHPTEVGGTSMSDLSTHSGLLSPPLPSMAADWIDATRGDAVPVTLKSGAIVSVPLVMWDTQALVLYGTADADAVDRVLRHHGLRAVRVEAAHLLREAPRSSRVAVQLWAPDYGGTSVGPIKAVFASIPVKPRQTCSIEHRSLVHVWWWWYYGNSVVNQEFKRDVWGVPNDLSIVETSYRNDAKSVRLLEKGGIALRLHLAPRRADLILIDDRAAGGNPARVKNQAEADKELQARSEALRTFAAHKAMAEADDDHKVARQFAKDHPEPAFRFVFVARREHDDGENDVSFIGSKLAGDRPDGLITFRGEKEGGQDECYRGAGTEVDKRLTEVDFQPVAWDFLTTYNGIVKMYDDKARAKVDRREQAEKELGRRLIEQLGLKPKEYS